jgi:hypothetical protein
LLGTALWRFTGGCLGVVAIGLALTWLFRQRRVAPGGRAVSWMARVVYAYCPSAAGLLTAFHLRSLPWFGQVHAHLSTAGADWSLTLLQLAQGTIVAAGGALTLWTLWQLCLGRSRPVRSLGKGVCAWLGLSVLAAASLLGGLALLAT